MTAAPTYPIMITTPEKAVALDTLTVVLGLFGVQILLPAVLIVATPKRSILRFLAIPCLGYAAYQVFELAPALSKNLFHVSFLSCVGLLITAHCINLLLILNGGLTWSDMVRNRAGAASADFFSKVISAARLVVSLRGVNTAWETKNLPQHPGSLGKQTGRASFLLRQAATLLWQYLFLDLLLESARHEPPENMAKYFGQGMEFEYFSLSREKWVHRVFATFFTWFAVGRVLLDSSWRASSLIFVGLGIDRPENWRPLFGSVWEAYTLRNFWGKYWHQLLRWPFTSNTNFLLRQVLHFPRPTALERYTNNFLVFLLSGLLHAKAARLFGLSMVESGAIQFFTSFALGYIIEDIVQAIYQKITRKSDKDKTAVWEKLAGFTWVLFWLSITYPWYLYPSQRALNGTPAWTLPYHIADKLGSEGMLGLLVGDDRNGKHILVADKEPAKWSAQNNQMDNWIKTREL
ncbi:membrane bound O-acyl transferase family-domain-containing protein [Stachybotrys elegans]|uniref:Membrane bound O-acyl transferase family-domain-containing protein n=1 Tax=Stachybotrys elegans TaxID=80388 RepID=A0A8K0SMM8_9HYPO|nr:membrane bound O-acyl transferase family-domain-containing protein [Stachybotrys elegans]